MMFDDVTLTHTFTSLLLASPRLDRVAVQLQSRGVRASSWRKKTLGSRSLVAVDGFKGFCWFLCLSKRNKNITWYSDIDGYTNDTILYYT